MSYAHSIVCDSFLYSACLLFPSSHAAAIVTAFAIPIPLYLVSSSIVRRPSCSNELLQSDGILFMRSTAVSVLVPLPMSIAGSSLFVRQHGDFYMNFSLGLSDSSHWFMFNFLGFKVFD